MGKLSSMRGLKNIELSDDDDLKIESISKKDIAIIGMAGRFAEAKNIKEYWDILRQGKDCIRSIPNNRKKDADAILRYQGVNTDNIKYRELGYLDEIDKFDYRFFTISPREASYMDPRQRLFLETVWEAIEDAGYGGDKLIGTNTGVFAGSGDDLVLDYKTLIYLVASDMLTSSIPGNLRSIIASRISYMLDLKGPTAMIDTACSSSLVAVHLACQAIKNGDCECAIAGGVDLSILTAMGDSSDSIGIESSNARSKTFDNSADGTGAGEGVTAVLLKPLARAVVDGDNIYGVIKGSAYNQDGRTIGITAPSPLAQEKVIVKAWKNAGIKPETISYIEAHGTGTDLGDPIEIEGINRAFSNFTLKKQFCAVGSVKTNIGHLNSTAGLAGLVKCTLALKNMEIPATKHFNTPNRKIDFENSPVYINDRLTKIEEAKAPIRVGVSSFGLSGTNCHVVLEQYKKKNKQEKESSFVVKEKLLTLSAKNQNTLEKLIRNYKEFLENLDKDKINNICYTANTGRGHYNYRIVIRCNDLNNLKQKLNHIIDKGITNEEIEDIYYGNHKIIPQNKPTKEKGELFEKDKQILSQKAENALEQLLSNTKQDNENEHLDNLCRLYVGGADVQWEALYGKERLQKVSLPTYPFERERCWVNIPDMNDSSNTDNVENIEEYFSKCEWNLSDKKTIKLNRSNKDNILIFLDEKGIGKETADILRHFGNNVIEVKQEQIQEGYDNLFSKKEYKNINKIIHLMTIEEINKSIESIEELNLKLNKGIFSVFNIVQALFNNKIKEDIEIILISENAHEVTEHEKNIFPQNASMFGFAKSIKKEYANLNCRCIDIDQNISPKQLVEEIYTDTDEYITAYREGDRYEYVFSQHQMDKDINNKIELKSEGVYLITGGLGGIGFEICKHLVSYSKINVALIGRYNILEKINNTNQKDKKIRERLKIIEELNSKGANISYYSADVASIKDMELIVAKLRKSYGRINGIIHSAGTAGGGFIIRKKHEEVSQVIEPKILGTWILDTLTKQDNIDFYVLFSSITSIFSGAGQSDYTAANSYIDSYAALAKREGHKRVLSINWATWKQVGMAVDYGVNFDGIFKALTTATAVKCLESAFESSNTNVVIGKPDYSVNRDYWDTHNYIKILEYEENKQENLNIIPLSESIIPQEHEVEICGDKTENITKHVSRIAKIWAEYLGVNVINVYEDFYEMGGDSIIAIKIINKVRAEIQKNIDISDLLDNPTITSFAELLSEQENETIEPLIDIDALEESVQQIQKYDLSNSQKRLWLLQKVNPKMTAYNIPFEVYVDYEMDIEKFNMALNILIDRHSALRTVFIEEDGIPKQVILTKLELNIEIIDTIYESKNLEDCLKEDYKYIFELDNPLIRMKIYKLKNENYCIHFNLHHIIFDGWSSLICKEEIIEIYSALMENRLPRLAPLKTSYIDWVRNQHLWLESEEAEQMLSYWHSELSGQLPVLNLPFDYQRPKTMTFNGSYVKINISKDKTSKLRDICKQTKVTPHIFLLSIYIILMQKISLDDDIIVGIPESGRYNKDIENVVGLFINTFCIRAKLHNYTSFKNVLNYIKTKNLQAYDNFKYPFDLLVSKLDFERHVGVNPIFNTMFQIYQTIPPENEGATQFDLSLFCIDLNDTIEGRFEYNTNLFKRETVENISKNFLEIFEAVLDNTDINLSNIKFENINVEKEETAIKEEIDFSF